MTTLSSYIRDTRSLLNDTRSTRFTDIDYTIALNRARRKLVMDTLCTRKTVTFSSAAGVSSYDFWGANTSSSPTVLFSAFDIYLCQYLQGNVYQNLIRAAPNQFLVIQGQNTSNQGTPLWYSVGGGVNQSLFLYPIPSSVNTVRCNIVYYPADFLIGATVDGAQAENDIRQEWADCVPYLAASFLKEIYQAYDDAQQLEALYQRRIRAVGSSVMRMRG